MIDAFNANVPFDQFTREQLAGDLLPEATEKQNIAATYNRLGMMTAEEGAQAKAYFAIYAADRVRNLSGTWLGSTMGCAQCHDHKFDPFTTRDFYSMAAFFAEIKERGVYAGTYDKGIWGEVMWMTTAEQQTQLQQLDEQIAALQLKLTEPSPELDAVQAAWEAEQSKQLAESKLPKELLEIVRLEPSQRTDEQALHLVEHFREISPFMEPTREELKKRQEEKSQLENSISKMPRTVAAEPREIRVLPRRNWMDDSGPIVQPAVPDFLAKLDTGDHRVSRLDLATWLTSEDNPLTSRTLVNRLWKLFFGGVRRGMTYGATDELGYNAVENVFHIRDFHVTMLHQLGINHERFIYPYQGLDMRLTGVEPARVVKDVLV